MKPAALYLRVSTDDGRQTVENQRRELITMAQGRGFEVAAEYADEVSGSKGKAERPGLRALFDAAARGKFRAVLVWALDRWSRDGTFLGGLMMVGELDRFGVALLSYQETYIDTAGPFREPLIALALKLAQHERDRLLERTRAGIARAKAAGVHCGRRTAGVPSAAVQEAVKLRTLGWSWERCAVHLELRGFGTWDKNTLRRACKRGGQEGGPKAA